ncbi:MAG: sulfide/dihydroorotate dehydrogenase-like FAD/NAD-binding protein [Deltaproteobacteria bacterium]|jgi:ferredoxin--NADP+ reductase|nr:sulfide/dihydroorotate dehydrogenase-like FAD/NAD-binding protein [Deltaproteobacteria bacterium]
MPSKIIAKKELIPGRTSLMLLDAPHIAATAKPGNFVILRVGEKGERFPLTIADLDEKKGTITIVFLVMGKSTAVLNAMREGESVFDLCGPLGKATRIHKIGTVVCVGGGTGVAAMHHIAKGHHLAGNHVVAAIGARSENLLLFRRELEAFCDEVLVATDDGSTGHKGLVTEVVEQRLAADKAVGEVVAVGPVPMMSAVVKTVKPFQVPVTVSLNSMMVDGIGMCGACRVSVGGETKFTCVDGPEFDGYLVNFAELQQRLAALKDKEKLSYDNYCKCGHHE